LLKFPTSNLNQFGYDADGNLFRSFCTYWQTDGGIYLIQTLLRDTFFRQCFVDYISFPAAADHAYVPGVSRQCFPEHRQVESMPPGNQDNVG
jgi:hypothetical protein